MLLLLVGCQKLGGLSGIGEALEPYRPDVSFEKLDLQEIDFSHVEVDLLFSVNNKAPVGLSLASLDYQFELEGEQVLSGEQSDGLSLPADGQAELTVPISLTFSDISSLLGAAKGKDVLEFGLSGDMGIDTPAGVLQLPYSAAGELPVLRAPSVALSGLRVDDLALLENRATVALDLSVTNDGGASIGLKDLDYTLKLAGAEVADGQLSSLGSVDGGSTQTVSLPINLTLTSLGSAALEAIKSGGQVQVGLSGGLSVETPYGSVPLSIDRSKELGVR